MSHPDSRVLAEFRAGLIEGRHGARISAHLATCEDCADLCDRLAEVSVLLAAAPVPALPDRVARRLDTVLAAEAAQRDNSERAGVHSTPGRVAASSANGTGANGTGADGTGAHRPGRHWNFRPVALRVLAPAAAAVLLAAGGYGLAQIGTSAPTASTVAGAASAASAAPSVVHGAASSSRAEARPQIEAPAFQVVIGTTDYRRDTLRQQLEQELRLHPRGTAAPPSVEACVLLVIRGISQATLQLVETAYFQGQPATVIVAMSGHQQVAWVAGDGCSATEKDLLATTTLSGTSAA